MNRAQLIKDIKNNMDSIESPIDHSDFDLSEYTDSEIWELFKETSKDYNNYNE